MPRKEVAHAKMPQQPQSETNVIATASSDSKAKPKIKGAQLRFSLLIESLDRLNAQKLAFDAIVQKHRANHLQALDAHEKTLDQIQHDMLMLMHTRLQSPGLSMRQRMFLQDYIGSAIESLADQFADLKALVPQYVDQDAAAEIDQEALAMAQALRHQYEAQTGKPIEGADSATSAEELMDRMYRAMHADQLEEAKVKAKKRAARLERKKAGKRQKAQTQATSAADKAADPVDPKTALRAIFRQVASALHPDRETDPAERARKTELMSQANAAHERGDLVSLLKLQLQADRIDPQHLANMAEERVTAMCALLADQFLAKKSELNAAVLRACSEFRLTLDAELSDSELTKMLVAVREDMAHTRSTMEFHLDDTRTDAGLKRWIKRYKQSFSQTPC